MTTYFMMQAIIMSATGWLAGRFGRKHLYILSLVGFAVCSVLSGNATSIEEIMIYRGLQGMFSAPVVPISQALMLDLHPRERHAQAMSIWGIGVMFAPVMGPVIGGWLTMNTAGAGCSMSRCRFRCSVSWARSSLSARRPRTLNASSTGSGSPRSLLRWRQRQFLLDRGESEGWFDSDLIITTGVIVALAFYLFVAHSATTKNPFISLGILKDRNYMLGLLFMFLLGVLVLSMNVIMPLFLQNACGYPILTAALVMMPRGLGSLFGLVLAGQLSGKWTRVCRSPSASRRPLIQPGYFQRSRPMWVCGRLSSPRFSTALVSG